jgi:hypothetical protein
LLNIRDKYKNSLLHIASGFGRLKSVDFLLKTCPELIDQLDEKKHTPCDIAIKVKIALIILSNKKNSDLKLFNI